MSEYPFTDPVRHAPCTLVVRPGWFGVAHPDCDIPADVTVQLDSFYCRSCGWNGRVSGAWVVDMIEAEAS